MVRAGFALFEDLGTVDLCRITNKDSLIGERIPCMSIFVTGNLHHMRPVFLKFERSSKNLHVSFEHCSKISEFL